VPHCKNDCIDTKKGIFQIRLDVKIRQLFLVSEKPF
jgi:hypothetical protein